MYCIKEFQQFKVGDLMPKTLDPYIREQLISRGLIAEHLPAELVAEEIKLPVIVNAAITAKRKPGRPKKTKK